MGSIHDLCGDGHKDSKGAGPFLNVITRVGEGESKNVLLSGVEKKMHDLLLVLVLVAIFKAEFASLSMSVAFATRYLRVVFPL